MSNLDKPKYNPTVPEKLIKLELENHSTIIARLEGLIENGNPEDVCPILNSNLIQLLADNGINFTEALYSLENPIV